MKNEVLTAVTPDVEIIIRSGEHEVAVIGLFENKSDVWDVVIGIDDADNRLAAITVLETCVAALQAATFHEVRTTGA